MSEVITLELSESIMSQAREIASRTHRPVEAIHSEWLNRFITDLPVESLTDEEVLALCDSQMEESNQQLLSDLLDIQREGELTTEQREELDQLMTLYRQGLVRKAEAMKVAVARGLRKPLNQ